MGTDDDMFPGLSHRYAPRPDWHILSVSNPIWKKHDDGHWYEILQNILEFKKDYDILKAGIIMMRKEMCYVRFSSELRICCESIR